MSSVQHVVATDHVPGTAGERQVEPDRQTGLALGLAVLGIGLIVNSVLGPFLADAIDYPVSPSMRNQTVGLDAAALFLVAPACVAVAILAWRGHRTSPLLGLGLGSYIAYIFVQYLVGPEFDHYPRTLLFHLAMFVAGWGLSVNAWTLARRWFGGGSPPSARHAAAALVLAGFVVLRYLPGLAASLPQDPLPSEARADITMYWLIVVSDLGIFVPLTVATAIGILRAASWARPALVAIVTWFSIVSVAVGAMSLTMLVNDDPAASRAQLALFVVTSAAAVAYAAHLHRSLLDDDRPDGASEGSSVS